MLINVNAIKNTYSLLIIPVCHTFNHHTHFAFHVGFRRKKSDNDKNGLKQNED